MKKVLVFVLALFISGVTFGQFNFGIKGAVTMNKLTTDLDDWEDALKTSFQLGAFVRLGKKFHLQPEGYITLKNGEFNFVDDNGTLLTSSVKLTTLDVPLLIGYQIFKVAGTKFRVQAGPLASFVLNTNYDITYEGIDPDEEITMEEAFKKTNWGLQLGGGIDFLFLTLDVRYEFGLSNLWDDPNLEDIVVELPDSYKNNVFFVSLGWKIM